MADTPLDPSTFATDLITKLGSSAAEEAGSIVGGMLMNAVLQGVGFDTETAALKKIEQLEVDILNALSALESEIQLSVVDNETFQSDSKLTYFYTTMRASTTDATAMKSLMEAVLDESSGAAYYLSAYQQAIMQDVSVPNKGSLFIITSNDIINNAWGHVALADMYAAWQAVLNRLFAFQSKALSVIYNAHYADAYAKALADSASATDAAALAATAAQGKVLPFVNGGDAHPNDLNHQYNAWWYSVPEWLHDQQGKKTQFFAYLKNKQYLNYLTITWNQQQSHDGNYTGFTPGVDSIAPKTTALMQFTSDAVDSTDFQVALFNEQHILSICDWSYTVMYGRDPDEITDKRLLFGEPVGPKWRLIPNIDDAGMAATRFRNERNGDVYLCINHSTGLIDLTTDTQSPDSLWYVRPPNPGDLTS